MNLKGVFRRTAVGGNPIDETSTNKRLKKQKISIDIFINLDNNQLREKNELCKIYNGKL